MMRVTSYFLGLILTGMIVVIPMSNAQLALDQINGNKYYYDKNGRYLGMEYHSRPGKYYDANGKLRGALFSAGKVVTKNRHASVHNVRNSDDCTVNLRNSKIPGISHVLNFSKESTALVPLTPFNYTSRFFISSDRGDESFSRDGKNLRKYSLKFYPDAIAPRKIYQCLLTMDETTGKVLFYRIVDDKTALNDGRGLEACNATSKNPVPVKGSIESNPSHSRKAAEAK